MIDYIKSAELNNMTIDELRAWFDEYPKSNRWIVRICDSCKGERKIRFCRYYDLCHDCAVNTEEFRQLRSVSMIDRYSDPDVGIAQSERQIQYYIDHPEAREKISKSRIKYYEDPAMRDRISGEHNGKWNGGFDRKRPYVLPIAECIELNERFIGADAHHITKSMVAYIPSELHNHVWHNIKTGLNMGEMNALAVQFVNGGL